MDLFYLRFALFIAIIIPSAISDIRTLAVPRVPLLALFAALIATSAIPGSIPTSAESLAGGIEGFLILYGTRLLSRKKLGLADIWTGMCVGALEGIGPLETALALGIVSALIYALASRLPRNARIPFLPHLCAGAIIAEFFFRFFAKA